MLPAPEASPCSALDDPALGLSPSLVLDELPAGALVVDQIGVVRYANRLALDLLGWDPDEAVGRSLLDVVVHDDLAVALRSIAEAQSYFGEVLGPIRLRYADRRGHVRLTQFWARELPDRTGYVLVAPAESATDQLADAVRAITAGAPIESAIEHAVASVEVHPINGTGCLLRVSHGELVALTEWPLGPAFPLRGDRTRPWQLVQRTGLPLDIDGFDGLEDGLTAAMVARGYRSMWCRPVVSRRGDVVAVIVVFRTSATPASANQMRRLDDIVAIAGLAFDQLEDRSALELAAFTDPLTGAASRARLQREIEVGIKAAAVLYLDLDRFKTVNDRHGHDAGDAVLAQVADRLFGIVREHDLVVRVGGDEFVVVARHATRADAAGIASRIVAELAEPYPITARDGREVEVVIGVSVGVCVQRRPMTFHDALRTADEALGEAKRAGKGRFHLAPA